MGTRTSYTALPDSPLLILSISTTVTPGTYPVVPVGLTSVADVEALGLWGRSRLKASLKVPDRESLLILPWPSPSPASPASDPGSEVLPRTPRVKSTRRSFKSWMLLKRLKSVLASNVVQIHQQISMSIITSTSPTGSLAHNPLLNSNASRPKAERNATVLCINDVRPTDLMTELITTHAQSSNEYGRLYRIARVSNPRALCRRLRRYLSYHGEDVGRSE